MSQGITGHGLVRSHSSSGPHAPFQCTGAIGMREERNRGEDGMVAAAPRCLGRQSAVHLGNGVNLRAAAAFTPANRGVLLDTQTH